MKNPQNTKDLMSWLSWTIVPVTKCINMKITWTVIANHCLVHTMFQTAETFKKMKYTTIQKPEFKTINNRPHLVWGKGFLWEARRWVKELNDQLQSMIDLDPRDWYKIFLREYFHKPFNNNGRPVFPQERVEKLICPEYTVDERYPWLRIYRNEPWEYARWCDTADGGVGWDYSTITIRDRDQRMIASYQGHIISSDYVELLEYMIETYKFEWLIGIEKNRPQVIELAKVRYWNMLLYKIKTIDKITNQISQKYGFATTSQSKPLIIDKTVNKLCDGVKPILEVDDRAKVEMQNYYYDEQWRANAISPNHDDLVMSDMICLHMLDEM